MMEWKCKLCGQWVSMSSYAHNHVELAQPTLAEMIAQRDVGIDATDSKITTDRWSPAHETRKRPADA